MAAGEFRISATNPEGVNTNVVRLYNKTVRLSGNEKAAWNTNAEASTEFAISGITQADPAVVTVADTSAFTSGDIMTISGVAGMTEINDLSAEITVVDGTTVEFAVDSSEFTEYSSDGVMTGSGTVSSIDTQSS